MQQKTDCSLRMKVLFPSSNSINIYFFYRLSDKIFPKSFCKCGGKERYRVHT